jgi:hypothetical protein
MSSPLPKASHGEGAASSGLSLPLIYGLIALALAVAIGFALMIVFPFYLRR